MGFEGYERADGSVGIRNHVAVIASVACANGVVNALARRFPSIKPLTHSEGCGRGPKDLIRTTRTLCGLGKNPNVAGVLVVGLGCEFLKAPMIAGEIRSSGKPVEELVIQDNGGSQKTTELAVELTRRLLDGAASAQKSSHDWDKLTLGLDFGGLGAEARTANPALGVACEWLIQKGGRVIISESSEMVGSEDVLKTRAASEEVSKRIAIALGEKRRIALEVLGTDELPRGDGLASFPPSTKIEDLVEYGEVPKKRGLNLMDTPESDVFAVTGMAAGGAQLFVQTTEQGTPGGFPIAPLLKVSTNSRVFEMMPDDIDLDAGRIAGGESVDQVGSDLVHLLERTIGGEPSKAEAAGYDLMAILTSGPAF